MDDRHALTVGTMLRQYRIEKVIGQGGFGITYLAMDTDLNRHVAIKECYPKDFVERDGTTVVATSSDNVVNFDWALGKFVDEATTLARFKHSGIVQVLQILKEENSSAYMVLEFVEGLSFDAWLKGLEQRPDEAELKAVITPLFDALEVVHDNGIAHRDIAPDNIYIRDNGEAVLLDFGTAKQTVGHHTRTMNLVVKDGFSAPEQYYAEGRQGPWTDIYAFAATLYRAIAGKRPPDAMARQDALNNDEPDPLAHLETIATKGYSKAFLDAVMTGLTLQAKRRPQSLAEWRGMLLGSPPAQIDEYTKKIAVEPTSGESGHSAFGKAVAALLVLGLVGAGGYWIIQSQDTASDSAKAVDASPESAKLIPPSTDNPSVFERNPPVPAPTPAPKPPSVLTKPTPEPDRQQAELERKRQQAELERKLRQAELDREKAQRIAKKEEESREWQLARTRDTLASYQEFADRYPQSRHLKEAQSFVAKLEQPWSKTLGSGLSEHANSVAFNKESIAVGGSVMTAEGMRKGLVYLLSHSGKQRWRTLLSQNGEQEITDVLITANGDIVAAGISKVAAFSKPKGLLMRFDAKGNLKWNFGLGETRSSELYSVLELPNSDLVAVGSLDKSNGTDSDGWLLHVDAAGRRLGQSTHGGDGRDAFLDVKLTSDGQFAIAGRTQGLTKDNDDFWMMKLSLDGKAIWEKRYGGRMADQYSAVAVSRNGSFFVAGSTESYGSQSIDSNIGYVDQNNYMHPKPLIDKRGDDVLQAAAASKDGGVIVAGYTSSKGAGQRDGWISKYDSSLKKPEWEKVLGGAQEDRIAAIEVLSDGSIVAVGARATNVEGKTGSWVIKLGPNGDYEAR